MFRILETKASLPETPSRSCQERFLEECGTKLQETDSSVSVVPPPPIGTSRCRSFGQDSEKSLLRDFASPVRQRKETLARCDRRERLVVMNSHSGDAPVLFDEASRGHAPLHCVSSSKRSTVVGSGGCEGRD